MIELTKSQKKQVRALIEKGLLRDYTDGVKRVKAICDSFTEGASDPKEYYHKLYATLSAKDKDIARRYNDLRGSQYLLHVIMLLGDEVLTKDDLQSLDTELKTMLIQFMEDTERLSKNNAGTH
jgi:hypothetical protein